MAAKEREVTISVMEIVKGQVMARIRGTSPLIYNAMSEKARQQLLFPSARKSSADKAAHMKHEPFEEYRNSVYLSRDPKSLALLSFPPGAPHQAMATAALDMPGAKKTEIGRLTWIEGTGIEIFGTPQILTSVVRSADMNRTPDIRTRAILPEWACQITITYIQPKLNERVVGTLLSAAGLLCGIGDWRQEKGSRSFGQFELVGEDDEAWARIVKEQGRKAQQAALAKPVFYDDETRKLLEWFSEERERRGKGTRNGRGKADTEAQTA